MAYEYPTDESSVPPSTILSRLADFTTVLDPNNQITSSTDSNGVWSLTIAGHASSVSPQTSPLWLKPARTITRELAAHPLGPARWRFRIITPPSAASGVRILHGFANGTNLASDSWFAAEANYAAATQKPQAVVDGLVTPGSVLGTMNEVWAQMCSRGSTGVAQDQQSIPRFLTVSGQRSDVDIGASVAERTPTSFTNAGIYEFISVILAAGSESFEIAPEMQLAPNVEWL